MIDPTTSLALSLVSSEEAPPLVQIDQINLSLAMDVQSLPRFDRPLEVSVRQATLLNHPPWVRTLGKTGMEITTQGWRFPTPPDQVIAGKLRVVSEEDEPEPQPAPSGKASRTKIRPPRETVQFKDR